MDSRLERERGSRVRQRAAEGKTMNASETPGVTLEDVVSAENLNEAWARVKANAGAAGVDGRTVAQTAELICGHKEELLELILQHEMNHVPVQLIHLPLTLIFN
jgi:hypothetical protein